MFNQIVGTILIFAPFIIVPFYSSIREGLLKITLYTFIFHSTLSIITQIFHIFNYGVVISLNIIFILSLYIFHYLKRKESSFNLIEIYIRLKNGLKNNWILFGSVVIIFLLLFFVYNSYSGRVQTIQGGKIVSNDTYLYPFVSDEWVTISEIKYSIENQSLPVVNPLDHNISIPNILFVFPSFLAELFLLFNLNPLNYYWLFSVFFGLLLCVSVYTLLRTYKISGVVGGISILFIPYIVNSGNLLALWSLLPFTLGTIFLIWQLISQKMDYTLPSIFYGVLALMFYPPMMVFVFPLLFYYLYQDKIKNIKQNILRYVAPFIISIIIFIFIFYLVLSNFDITILGVFGKYFIRPNLDNGIVSYPIWYVVPKVVIIFAIIGIYKIIKNKYYELLILFGVGVIFWGMYSFVDKVFIIENQRIVFITSIFIIIIAGIGIESLFFYLIKKINYPKINKYLINGFGILVIIISLSFISSYASRPLWEKMTLNLVDEKRNKRVIIPAPPVNRYLTNDDLKLFENIHKENFISPPWKGLVIGVATGNYPFETKSATIGNLIFSYHTFMKLNCEDKKLVAEKFYLSYVYSHEFLCPAFIKVGSSSEDLHLYKYIKDRKE